MVQEEHTADCRNTLKYISLFPKEAEDKKSKKGKNDDDEDKEKLKLPKHLEQALSDELEQSERTRLTMLLETRRLMDEGKLSATPEVERERKHVEISVEDKVAGTKRKAAKVEVKEDADDFFASDEE